MHKEKKKKGQILFLIIPNIFENFKYVINILYKYIYIFVLLLNNMMIDLIHFYISHFHFLNNWYYIM